MAFGANKGRLTGAANSITNPFSATGSVAVVRGDLIFAVLGEDTNLTVTAVSDNLGNTYAATQAGTDAGTSTGRAFWAKVTNPGTLTSVSATCTASTDNVAFEVAVIEGPITTIDANPTNITTDITSPFTCPSTGTLGQANEIIMAWAVATGSTVWSATSPNLLSGQTATQTVIHTVIGYQAVSATTAVAPAFTAASNPTDAVLGTASFKRDDTPLGRMVAQYDWPNPDRLPWQPVSGSAATSPLAIASTIDSTNLPSGVTGWPVPLWPQWPLIGGTQSSPLALLGTPTTKPFAQTDWPNPNITPQMGRTWIQGSTLFLPTPPALLPAGVVGWPLPVLPQAPLLGGSQSSPVALLSDTAAKPFAQYDWPLPRIAPQPGQFWAQSPAQPVVAQPFAQLDWPLSRSAQGPGKTWLQGPAVPAPADMLPAGVTGWPLPVQPWQASRSFATAAPLSLTSAPVVKPFAQYDWPLPKRTPAIGLSWNYNLTITLPAPTAYLPAGVVGWPMPVQTQAASVSFVQPTPATLTATTYVFRDPLVMRKQQPQVLQQSQPLGSSIALLTAVAGPNPFAQLDWPLPKVVSTIGRTWTYNQTIFLPTGDTTNLPAGVTGWSSPLAPQPLNPSFTQVPSLALTQAPGPKPFAQTDWPRPVIAAQKATDLPPPNIALTQTVAAAKPFAQTDWPRPIVVPQKIADLAAPNIALAQTPAPAPFAQTDWPKPIVLPTKVGDVTSPNLALTQQPSPQPFAQYDWPIPRALQAFFAPQQPRNLALLNSTVTGDPVIPPVWMLPIQSPIGSVGFASGTPLALSSGPTPPPPGKSQEWLIRARRRRMR